MKKMTIFLLAALFLLAGCGSPEDKVLETDICIYGGTSAGVIAAYSADKMGKSVILVEPGSRLGGLTTGGLGQTDIGNKYAVTGLARDFYRRLGSEYGQLEAWKFEPKVALKVYHDYLKETDVQVIYQHRLNRVIKKKGVIKAVCLENSSLPDSMKIFINARQYIDCSYEGDLMARSGVDFTIGRESNAEYGERYNGVQLLDQHQFPDSIDPYILPGDPSSGLVWGVGDQKLLPNGTGDLAVQAYNFRVCLTDSIENMVPITAPENYDPSKYELLLRLIEKSGVPSIYNHFIWSPMPGRKTDINNKGGFSTDMIGMNWEYPAAGYSKREEIFRRHKEYTIGLFYFLMSDPRVPEAMRTEMQRWGYPKDEYTEFGHFTPQLYVREARRMVGEYVMTEANCVGEAVVEDAIGMAAYTMDSHNCQRLVVNGMVKNEGDVQIGGFPPYPISYRSITPKREECVNLLVPVDLSATHIAYGSIRMEPVFMVLGQSAAIAACMAMDAGSAVQEIDVKQLQELLKTDPLLDGSQPEFTIDNSEAGLVSYSEDFTLEKTEWRDKAYKLDYLYNSADKGERRVKFTIEVPETGQYKIYYYCPSVFHISENGMVTNQLPINIISSDAQVRVVIPFAASAASWAYCGNYNFEKGTEAFLEVDGKGLNGAFAADAIVLIPN